MSARPPPPHFPGGRCRPYGAEREPFHHRKTGRHAGRPLRGHPAGKEHPMDLRRYRTEDLPALSRLFGETVRRVNIRDYTPAQAEAWAAGEADLLTRDDWFRRLYTLVAEVGRPDRGLRQRGRHRLSGPPVRPVGLPGPGRRHGPLRRAGGTLPGPGAGPPSPSTPPRPPCRFSSTGTTGWSGSSRCRCGGRC